MNNSSARDALIEQIKKSDNILVAVSANPTIDELTAALGLTLILNKTNDHVTTIFSGEIPSVLNFLQPNKFFDKTVDGLRDFIIALDPDKADRVRTKVVDGLVRVSITPSKGAVTVDDLEFSQGDYNVDLVIALGVEKQADLDKALEAHGRILHSAFVASIGVGSAVTELGNLNWQEPALQSYAQIVADLSLNLEPKLDDNGQPVDTVLIDSSVATALMTGLVSITDRFSNNLTTPELMSLAAVLMGQGANQQLIAKELDEPNKIAALKQSLNQANQTELVSSQLTTSTDSQSDNAPEDKIEHEAVINHHNTVDSSTSQVIDQPPASAEAKALEDMMAQVSELATGAETAVSTSVQNSVQQPDQTSNLIPEVDRQPSLTATPATMASDSVTQVVSDSASSTSATQASHRPIYGGVKSASTSTDQVDLNQLIDKMIQSSQPKAATPTESGLPTIEPPVAGVIIDQSSQSNTETIGQSPASTDSSVTTQSTPKAKAKLVKDESWDKVSQFKQAFLDKIKKDELPAAQACQQNLAEIQQAEAPEPPQAPKAPIEVANPQTDHPDQLTTTSTNPSSVDYRQLQAETGLDVVNQFIETPANLPNRRSSNSAQAAGNSDDSQPPKTNLQKKPVKVIKPLDKSTTQAQPSLDQQIAQELNPLPPAAPSIPPLPDGLTLPPPLPPMPPALDPMTMTSLPPIEADLNNNPFDALSVSPSNPLAAPSPAAPPLPPKPNFDAQLTPQEAKAIGLHQSVSIPPASSAPIPENQFVIPE